MIVFVPGLWEGPTVYTSIASTLQVSYGYTTTTIALVSTGTTSPGNPSLQDDVRGIRLVIEPLVEQGKELLLVLHSAGGFLGSNAIKGLTLKDRTGQGKKGGVQRLVFLAAGLAPEGYHHQPLPFFEYHVSLPLGRPFVALINDIMFCPSPTLLCLRIVLSDVSSQLMNTK